MGGGKGEISITGSGTSPVSEYSEMSNVLPTDFPVFEDGAGEVETMPPGGWVDDGGPPWYYEFTNTLSDFDYFGFSLYAFFFNRVDSVGELAADGDYYIDFATNRVYIYGVAGSAPAFEGYCHMAEAQVEVTGDGPTALVEDFYDTPMNGVGVIRLGSLRPTYRVPETNLSTAIDAVTTLRFSNGIVYGFAHNSTSDNAYNQTPSRKGRGGFYYSEDDGATWSRSGHTVPGWEENGIDSEYYDQWLNGAPVRYPYPNPSPPPNELYYTWNLGGSEVSYCGVSELSVITNSTNFNTPTQGVGFMPMSSDGAFGLFFTTRTVGHIHMTGKFALSGTDVVFVPAQSYGRYWHTTPQIPYHLRKPSMTSDGYFSGNSMSLRAVCRDARAIIDPLAYGGYVYGITSNKEVVRFLFDGESYFYGAPSEVIKLSTLSGNSSSTNRITSTYDPLTDTMWLHAFTYITFTGGWGFRYHRSSDGGFTWSSVNFAQTHDPDWGSSNWRYDGEAKHMNNIQILVSPDCRNLFMSTYHQESFGFLSYRWVSSHLWRSTDHGVSWDKLSQGRPFDTGSGTGTQGWSRGADGYYRTPGNLFISFLGEAGATPPTVFYIICNQYVYGNIYRFETNLTGSHAGALDSITFPAFNEEPHINGNPDEYGGWRRQYSLTGNPNGDIFLDDHSPRYNESILPCGFHRQGTSVQKINDYFYRTGGYGKHKYLDAGCNNYGSSPYDRGDYIEFSIAPIDATTR